jgi:photosystem II stability/assembly factor-like uncharacterized protein
MDKYKVSSRGFILRKSLAVITLVFAFFALQCTHKSSQNTNSDSVSNPKNEVKKEDLIQLEYAKNFRVYVEGNDTIIEIKDAKNIWKKKAKKHANKHEVKVPIESFINLMKLIV